MCALQQGLSGLVLLAACAATFAQSPFDGTWRPDPQRAGPDEKPDEYSLSQRTYECRSCIPPYKVPADGRDHPVGGNPRYDAVSVQVIDGRTVARIAKKQGQTIAETRATVSADGNSLVETQRVFGMGPVPIELTSRSTRIGQRQSTATSISGSWRRVETDLTNHDEDTTFKVDDQTLSMTDRMGRSFQAKLDGTKAPYKGSPEFNSVAVKLVGAQTLEESDIKDGTVVKICTWTVEPDGRTMHARFDDLHGRIQEQTGHKLP
jgi:hypothetical protein